MKNFFLKTCKNCGSTKFKSWADLSDDERYVARKLLGEPNEFGLEKNSAEHEKKHRAFCGRCFYESFEEEEDLRA